MIFRTELPNLLVSRNLPLRVAEIGVAEGLHSLELLQAGLYVYLVDNWSHIPNVIGDGNFSEKWHMENYEKVQKSVKGYEGRYTILKGLSVEMSKHVEDRSLGMVYVDADHSYEGVKRDIHAWYPKLVPGGVMAFHDYLSIEYFVKEAVEEFAKNNNLQIYLIPELQEKDAGVYFYAY